MKDFYKYLAELVGAFFLTLAVGTSLASGAPVLPTPVVAALTLGIFVYTVGKVSGAHLNPAVTLGVLSVGKIEVKDAVIYIVFQVVGAALAMAALQGFGVEAQDGFVFGVWEAVGAFLLTFGVCSLVYEQVDGDAAGVVVGGSLLLGILVAGSTSLGILNPAVAIGLGAINFAYLLGPIVGGIAAAWTYKLFFSKS